MKGSVLAASCWPPSGSPPRSARAADRSSTTQTSSSPTSGGAPPAPANLPGQRRAGRPFPLGISASAVYRARRVTGRPELLGDGQLSHQQTMQAGHQENWACTASARPRSPRDMQAPAENCTPVYAVDIKSTASSPGHFSTNVNAYCTKSGITESGSRGRAHPAPVRGDRACSRSAGRTSARPISRSAGSLGLRTLVHAQHIGARATLHAAPA